MKIGIEAQRLFRNAKHGMDIVVLELIRNLQLLDTENEYVIFVKPDEDSSCIHETANFKIVEIDSSPYPYWEQVALPRMALKENCDILHSTSNTAPVFSSIPSIITLHDIIYMEQFSLLNKAGSWYQKFGNVYRRFIVPSVVKRAQKVITVSNFEKQRIARFFNLNDDALSSIYNGVGDHFQPTRDKERILRIVETYNLPDNYVFFLGNTDPKKNTKNVLKAFSVFRKQNKEDIYLVMPDYKEKDLKNLLLEIGDVELRKYIHLTGYIDNHDLPAIYSLSKLFLYPSLRESFGIPILEAMACGTPVITSNTSSMPEISGDAAVIVNPKSSDEIVEAMEGVLSSQDNCLNIIEKGFIRAQSFTWRSMAEQVLKTYMEVHEKTNRNNH